MWAQFLNFYEIFVGPIFSTLLAQIKEFGSFKNYLGVIIFELSI